MKLSKFDRLFLRNQFLILEKLYPNKAADFAGHRTAIEEGYELQYEMMVDGLWDELSSDACREVQDILDLHRALRTSYENSDKSGVDPEDMKFRGFDGNNEGHQMAYTRFLIEKQGRWPELEPADYNSHHPTLPRYRALLAEWDGLGKKHGLSKDEIQQILGAWNP